MTGNQRLLELDDLVETYVGVEVGLDLGEDGNGAVGTITTEQRILVNKFDQWQKSV